MCVDNLQHFLQTKVFPSETIISVKSKGSGAELQGFLSDLIQCSVTFQNRSLKHLFLKRIPDISHDEQKSFMFNTLKIHQREAEFYKCVSSVALKEGIHIPKLYYADDHVLVLEDVCSSGTTETYMKTFDQYLTLDEAKKVLRNLGHFHALPLKYTHLLNNEILGVDVNLTEMVSDMAKDAWSKYCSMVELSTDVKQKCEEINKNIDKWMGSFQCESSEHFNKLLLHGDLWSNNVIFQSTESGEQNAVLIDFQWSYTGDAFGDVWFFLYSSVPGDIIELYELELLKCYYEAFNQTSQLFIPFDDFLKDVTRSRVPGYLQFMVSVDAFEAIYNRAIESGDISRANCVLEKMHFAPKHIQKVVSS